MNSSAASKPISGSQLPFCSALLSCAAMPGGPLSRASRAIPVEIDGIAHLILMTQMVSIPAFDLGAIVGSAEPRRDAVIQAVDLLVTGF